MLEFWHIAFFECTRNDAMKKKKILYMAVGGLGVFLLLAVTIVFSVYQLGKRELREAAEWTIDNAALEPEDTYHTIVYQGKEYEYRKDIVNVLCLGIDKKEQLSLRNDFDHSVGQADAVYLASIDTKKHEMRILAIPRDTMVILQMYNDNGEYLGMRDGQLTLQYAYADGMEKSAQLMVGQVSKLLYGVPVNTYVAINIYSLWNVNAAVGGVYLTMDQDYTNLNPAFVQGETILLQEKLVEDYLRVRDTAEAKSAYTRMQRQKQYMLAFFETAKNKLKTDITLPFRLLDLLEKDMETDVTLPELAYLLTQGLQCGFSNENIYTLPGEQVSGEEYEEFHVDEEAAEELILKLFYEEKK